MLLMMLTLNLFNSKKCFSFTLILHNYVEKKEIFVYVSVFIYGHFDLILVISKQKRKAINVQFTLASAHEKMKS